MVTCVEAVNAAEELVDALKEAGYDYSSVVEKIAIELFHEGLLHGNWDVTVEFDDPSLKPLRAIQEDEYDQSMDDSEEDVPAHEDMLCYICHVPSYIWFA